MGGAAGGLMVLLCVNTRQEEIYEASCECERIGKLETDENGIFFNNATVNTGKARII